MIDVTIVSAHVSTTSVKIEVSRWVGFVYRRTKTFTFDATLEKLFGHGDKESRRFWSQDIWLQDLRDDFTSLNLEIRGVFDKHIEQIRQNFVPYLGWELFPESL